MKWIYYDYMGRFNPVCNDIGDIEEILESSGYYTNSLIGGIKANGVYYGGDTKPLIVKYGHFFPLEPYVQDDDAQIELRNIPHDIKHGDELEVSPHVVWNDAKNNPLQPICDDPRILYIAFRGWEICPSPSKEEVERWKHDIPTREKAEKWLQERDLLYNCVPLDYTRMKRLTPEEADAELRKLVPRAFAKKED